MNSKSIVGKQSAISHYFKKILISMIFLFLIAVGFNTVWAADKSTDQLLNDARSSVKSVSIQEVKELIERKEKMVLLERQRHERL